MAKKNWTEGAGVNTNKSGPDEYYTGKSDSDEGGDYTGIAGDGAAHLASDKKLEAYIKEIASDYSVDYNKSWGPKFHDMGASSNYSKSKPVALD